MRQKGFTLIEILLAVLILGVVMTTVYASYTGVFRIIAAEKTDSELYGAVRVALARIARDLEGVSPWKGAFLFVAEKEELNDRELMKLLFRSSAHVLLGNEGPPAGVAVIEYTFEEDEEGGGITLYRSDSLSRTPENDDQPPPKFPLCKRLEGLDFLFFDAKGGEYESWDSGAGDSQQRKKAPAIVEIRLELTNEKAPDQPLLFMTRVRLPLNGQQ